MLCPNDNETLTRSERSGVEIDFCPKCHGIWLDRGELEKIMRTVSSNVAREHSEEDEDDDNRKSNWHEQDRHNHNKKRESFLSDIFGGFGGD